MIFETFITLLRDFPPEIILGFEYITCCTIIILMARFFGIAGFFSYIALATIVANIQVLKAVHFSFFHFPVALGTIVFSSTFLAVDAVTEFYGPQMARKAIWMGFFGSIIITLFMMLTMSMPPAFDPAGHFSQVDRAIHLLFLPAPAILAASLISYLISQHADIWIYQLVRRFTGAKKLWLRTLVSSLASALLDNIIFSILAWRVFSQLPLTTEQLIFTYILGTYTFRIIIILVQMPLMYGMRTLIQRENHGPLHKL